MSTRRLKELIHEGVLPEADRGAVDIDVMRKAYIEHLRKVASGRGGGEGQADKAAEEALRIRALRKIAELKEGQMSSMLIPADDVAQALHDAVQMMKTSLLAIPAKAAARLGAKDVARAQQVIKDEVVDALEALARVRVVGSPGA